nr:immunoglobulin heavy chain junction region [Macaca mulatta]MOX94988.1 immunoglobulin heavy chain junction region [Macaca mulatta]
CVKDSRGSGFDSW